MSCGILARCDNGGLAALTREVHRHCHPDRTLLLDLEEQGRGNCTPDEYIHGNVYRCTWKGGLPDRALEWIVAPGIDSLWSAEFWYDDRLLREAHGKAIKTVCCAMPELSSWAIPGDTSICPRLLNVPTEWRRDTLPNAQVLPVPIARDRLPFRHRTHAVHLYHPTGAAMLDRNGTQLLLDALPFVTTRELSLTIRSERPVNVPACNVDVAIVSDAQPDYWDAYPDDIDLLVLPRRYGGLSLPVQECASLGVPSLMLASDPYAQAPFVTSVPSTGSHEERMKGGRVPVHAADPRSIATALDWLVRHPDEHADASRSCDAWAAGHSWETLGPRWRQVLGA